MKRGVTCAFWGLSMLVLILDSATALAGAAEGVSLCLGTLIPGLFPFFVLSGLLTASLPRGGLLAAGILGGYPVGARSAAQAFRAGQLTGREARRMAVLCNCPGPAFIFGVAGQFFSPGRTALLWAVYLTSLAILWLVMPGRLSLSPARKPMSLNDTVSGAVRAMAGVCGWVILMRTVLAVLERWVLWLLPLWARAAVCGILELTNGVLLLRDVEENLRFVLAAGLLGFGGLCVMMQSFGVAGDLKLMGYFPGKLFQGCVCVLLSALATRTPLPPAVGAGLGILGGLCVVKLRKNENSYGNLRPVGV